MKRLIFLLAAVGAVFPAAAGGVRVTGANRPGGEVVLEFDSPRRGPEKIQLLLGGRVCAEQAFEAKPGTNRQVWRLPPDLGGNAYLLRLERSGLEGKVEIASPYPVPAAIRITGGRSLPDGVEFSLGSAVGHPVAVTVLVEIGGRVCGGETATVPAGEKRCRHRFSPELLKNAAGRDALLLLTAAPGENTLMLPASFPGTVQPLPKPVNHGVYTDGHGRCHAWYMNHASQYIFDGAPYFPVGGMWSPRTPGNTSSTPPAEPPEKVLARAAEDIAVLDRIQEHGIRDVYINLGSWAKPSQIQYFVDLLEKRGVRYGWQLNAKNGSEIPAFFITFDRKNAPRNWQGPIRSEYRRGRISFDFPREFKATGFLATDGAGFSRLLPFRDAEGVDVRKGIDVDDGKDFSKQREISLVAELPLAEGTPVTLIPLVAAQMRHPDLWNAAVREEIRRKFDWVGAVKWGPNFRFFVDPVVNEGNMLNATENLRQYTPEINRAFRRELERKYRTLPELCAAWRCEIPDFETAARLVPCRTGAKLLLLDPETGAVYPSEPDKSLMWFDYNELIRRSYAGLLDEVSAELKRLVCLPVVNKLVGTGVEELHISRRYCGSDGIGFEVYLNHGCAQEASGGGAVAAAAVTPHTVWKVATEAGFSARPGNGGHRFFPDEKTLSDLAGALHSMGANGFFFFGIALPGIWKEHSVWDQPEKLAWLDGVRKRFVRRSPAPEPRTFLFPAGSAWWYWSDRFRALYDAPAGEIVQSLRLPDGEWAYATQVAPPESAERVILHLPRPPYSRFHAAAVRKLFASECGIVFLGGREDLGTLPEVDRFFTGRTIRFADGSTAAELKPLPGCTVLASENGRPWALRHGRVLIVSRTPVTPAQHNRNLGFLHLKSEWLETP
ncbi:hypothetical protein [Victivallis vadensis]|uniref:hypothetical protein n=1 Tax=Victivallis vadensis TaxID=172901 RepID=UPI003AF75115